ncbi:hypothetical protein Fcan01_11159 [Folsomia candida]|uniref:Uncharacterized protein n=1 Tax=Folsomia candida TaxID=158441 RepID=A0A226ED35_FOLCA|nr:hypothetical protein Fcan01_11159 [Folsomia candida]
MNIARDDSEFSVTLLSNHSADYYPNNSAFNFCNEFYKPIDVSQNYEVALSEIFYKEKDSEILPVQNEKKTYFGQSIDDNVITLTRTSARHTQIPKIVKSLDTFLAVLQTNVEGLTPSPVNESVSIKYFYDDNVIQKVILEILDPKNELTCVIGPPIFCEMLGFDTNRFSAGVHVTNRPVDRDLGEEIEMNTLVVFSIQKEIQDKIKVTEPSSHNVEMLILNCATALALSDYDIHMSYDIETTTLQVLYPDYPRLSIKFPAAVNEALGLPESYKFQKNITIFKVSDNLEKLNESRIKYHPGQQIVVHSSKIAGQVFGSRSVQSLRIFPRKPSKDVQHIAFSSLYFHPLNCAELCNFDIKLTTENFKPLFSSEFATVVVLKFRAS